MWQVKSAALATVSAIVCQLTAAILLELNITAADWTALGIPVALAAIGFWISKFVGATITAAAIPSCVAVVSVWVTLYVLRDAAELGVLKAVAAGLIVGAMIATAGIVVAATGLALASLLKPSNP